MEHPATASRPTGDVERAFEAETTELIARRVSLGAVLFVSFAGPANALQWFYMPERWHAILLSFSADLLVCAAAAVLARRVPAWARLTGVIGAVALAVRFGAYFAAVKGGTEECVIALIAYLSGLVVVCPWGFRAQAVVSLGALAAYGFAVVGDAQAVLPVPFTLFALLSAAALTTLGAHLLHTHRWAAYRRAAALQRANALQREEQQFSNALLQVAAGLNAAIREPHDLAEQIAEHTRQALGADWVTFWGPTEEGGDFRCGGVSGLTAALADQLRRRSVDRHLEPALFQALLRDEAVELGQRDARRFFSCAAIEPILASALARAITRNGQIIGVVVCSFATRREPFTPWHHRLLAGIAHQAAVALENARLMEEARGASRTKSEFVATVSHELRTPLNVILGYTDLLMEGAFGPPAADQRDALQRVRQQSMQLLDLIQPMLDLSRLEARGVPITVDEFRISDLFDALRASIPTNWCKPGVRLNWHVEPDIDPVIRSDRGKFEMILRNLIHNALKYTEAGEVTISATAHIDLGRVVFSVRDTGPGIAAADLPAIFDMFQQSSSNLPRGGGVGLGLYIVKRLTDVLGGQVTVESQPGVGSRFTVSLPIELPPAARPPGSNGSHATAG